MTTRTQAECNHINMKLYGEGWRCADCGYLYDHKTPEHGKQAENAKDATTVNVEAARAYSKALEEHDYEALDAQDDQR